MGVLFTSTPHTINDCCVRLVHGKDIPGLVSSGSVCYVWTQDPENFDEEVKSLVTAWRKHFLYDRPLHGQAVTTKDLLTVHPPKSCVSQSFLGIRRLITKRFNR